MLKLFLIIILVVIVILYLIARFFYKFAIESGPKPYLGDFDAFAKQTVNRPCYEWFEPLLGQNTWLLESYDGLTLFAETIPLNAPTRKVAILCHGYVNSSYSMAFQARFFHQRGYHVVMPDARGHGKSEGEYIGFGWDDRLDMTRWIQRVLIEYGEDCEIVLFGISMGAATVMMTAGTSLPQQVKAIIQDCGYTSVYDELKFQLKQMFKLPAFPILSVTSLYTKYKAGYSFKEASALAQVKNATCPILMIHGDADKFVPFWMLDRLYDAAPEPKRKLVVEGAVHGMAYNKDPQLYEDTLDDFLETYL